MSVGDIKKQVELNFSKELVSQGTGHIFEDSIHQILTGIGNDIPELKDVEYTILIEGGLKKKVDWEEFEALEKRVVLLEAKVRG